MKRILIFSTAYLPFVGGAEIAVKEITDRFLDKKVSGSEKYAFDLITVNLDGRQKKEEKIGNVMVYRLGRDSFSKFLLPFTGYFKARKLMKKYEYDAIWSIMASQASVAAAFVKKAFPEIPLLLTLQEGDEETHLERYAFGSPFMYTYCIRPFYTMVFKEADRITAISSYLEKRARDINSSVPIDVVPNAVDTSIFCQEISDADRERAAVEIGKEKGDRLIITTSRLVEKNGIADLVAALQYLPHSIKLAIVGTGELEQALRIQAKEQGTAERISFLGFKAHPEIPRYLSVADVFCRPSLSEGLGNSFIEAMAASVPVVATPVGGIPDFLKDGETGVFCEPGNPNSIAAKIQEVLANKTLAASMVKNAKKLVAEKYNWNIIAYEMWEVFETLWPHESISIDASKNKLKEVSVEQSRQY